MSLYNLVTDNFKEYDFDTEYCLYFVCESRDMSDESGTYIILLKLKTILFTWRQHNIGPNTHTLKCRNEDYQY